MVSQFLQLEMAWRKNRRSMGIGQQVCQTGHGVLEDAEPVAARVEDEEDDEDGADAEA